MFALLALGSALLYGAADFIGGVTSRRADTIAVVIVSQSAGLALVAGLLAWLGTPVPARHDWIWGAAAGCFGGIGVALLYRALAVGTMSLVAPVTAVCAVAVPVLAAVGVLGERPTLTAAVGIILAIGAIVLVSQANLLYLLGSRRGPLTLVVTLSSLYPASTVLLARLVLHERLSARQWVGVALAMIAILLIVAA